MKLTETLMRRNSFRVALFFIGLLLTGALFAPWIAPHDPNRVDLARKLQSPSMEHPMGTDHLGRDVLSRLIHGTRISMGAVFAILSLVMSFSLAVGCIAGFAGGWIDALLMRICEVFLTFPTFILAMFLVGVLGTGMTNVVLAIVLTHWAWYARIIRALVLSLKNREYILAARVAGTGRVRLVLRHIVPPVAAQVIILATLDVGHMMLHVSGLSFLGLGVQPPTPEWGVMINDARQYIWTHPQLIVTPGLMVFLSVMAFNIPGDALRDALDPAIRDVEV